MARRTKVGSLFVGLIAAIPILMLLNVMWGTVRIPFSDLFGILATGEHENIAWVNIVWMARIPQALTAIMAGASLAASGLMMQTLFRNPLAGPSILGISTGSNLGVAVLVLALNGSLIPGTIIGYTANVLAAFAGATAVLLIILYFSTKVKNTAMLLIIGIMIGYITSSIVSILNFYGTKENIQSFVIWGLGDFSNVTWKEMPMFVIFTLVGLTVSVLQIKPLNALLLGENYASNLGISIKRSRIAILLSTGLLTATATAFCGPIAFIGLAVPHVARMILGSVNLKTLLPITILLGAVVALLCNLLTTLPGENGILPVNAITSMLGAPVIIYVIFNRKKLQYLS